MHDSPPLGEVPVGKSGWRIKKIASIAERWIRIAVCQRGERKRREGSNGGTCIPSIILLPRVVIPRSSLSLSFSFLELTRAIVGGELQGEKKEKRLYGISRGLMGGVENNGGERERESSGTLWLDSRGRVAATHIKLIKVGGTQGVVYCTSPLSAEEEEKKRPAL